MLSIGDCIPNISDLMRCGQRVEKQTPSANAIREMQGWLARCNYQRNNPEVFKVICEYGAAELEHKNRKGLFIRGACGIGKSYGVKCLAAKFGWAVIDAKQLQEAFLSTKKESEFWRLVDAYDYFERPQMIVIDDVGTEDCPIIKYGTATNLIADVLNRRYFQGFHRNKVRTIVTCNLSDEQLRERYGVRIDDRLNEMFDFATVHGQSLRR
jgi:DNA replication protein DnaC